jgi:hypothetical protein
MRRHEPEKSGLQYVSLITHYVTSYRDHVVSRMIRLIRLICLESTWLTASDKRVLVENLIGLTSTSLMVDNENALLTYMSYWSIESDLTDLEDLKLCVVVYL